MINEHAHTYYFITRSHVQIHNIICAYILYEMGSI